eukprot:GCRY01003051.1.p1 GENE.GCRY01003051.1~~GCRY01003051.1.p1  ORF type:complete len:239 (+),score=25.73 GCRY01003051.1:255-971(+)
MEASVNKLVEQADALCLRDKVENLEEQELRDAIDLVFSKYLSLSQWYVQEKERLCREELADAFWNLSMARHKQGGVGIEPYQYDSTMKPLVSLVRHQQDSIPACQFSAAVEVVTDKTKSPLLFDIQRKKPTPLQFNCTMKKSAKELQNPEESCTLDGTTLSQVREEMDPILWFGGLPSPLLKKAQIDFQKSLEFLVHLGSVDQQLKYLENLLQTLLARRRIAEQKLNAVENENAKHDG